MARTLDGVAQNSHLRSDNYFYYNCLTGRYAFHHLDGAVLLLAVAPSVSSIALLMPRGKGLASA